MFSLKIYYLYEKLFYTHALEFLNFINEFKVWHMFYKIQ